MTLRGETASSIRTSGVVAVVPTREPDRVTAIAEALLEGGVTAIEITTTVPGAVDALRTLAGALTPTEFFEAWEAARASAFLAAVKQARGG
ncbi:MAG: hypothetical protein ABI548_22250 [Polyangiaceae bacterium]